MLAALSVGCAGLTTVRSQFDSAATTSAIFILSVGFPVWPGSLTLSSHGSGGGGGSGGSTLLRALSGKGEVALRFRGEDLMRGATARRTTDETLTLRARLSGMVYVGGAVLDRHWGWPHVVGLGRQYACLLLILPEPTPRTAGRRSDIVI